MVNWRCSWWCQWGWWRCCWWYGWWSAVCHVITRSGSGLLWHRLEWSSRLYKTSTSYISSLRKLSLASHRGSHTGHWPPGSHHRQQAPVDRKRGNEDEEHMEILDVRICLDSGIISVYQGPFFLAHWWISLALVLWLNMIFQKVLSCCPMFTLITRVLNTIRNCDLYIQVTPISIK